MAEIERSKSTGVKFDRDHDDGAVSRRSNASSAQSKKTQSTARTGRSRSASVFLLSHHNLDEHDEDQFENKHHHSAVPWWTSKRFWLAILSFFGFSFLYATRVNLSIGIVCMTSPPEHKTEHANAVEDEKCATAKKSTSNSTCGDEPCEFQWSKIEEGLLLGSFYGGYILTQVVGGRFAEKGSPKKIIAMGMFPVAILSMLSPEVARLSVWAFIVLRVLMGMGQGVMYPAAQALWSRWAPPQERSILIGISYAGGQFGNALVFPISGFLCAEGFDRGWGSVFYVIGGGCFLWCCLWVLFCCDSPAENKRITEVEKEYIEHALLARKKAGARANPPWGQFFKSRPFWAIIIAHTCGNYGIYMCLSKIPSYMKEVLKFDLKSNGAMSMLPYLTFWFCITLGGVLADKLISREKLSVVNTRKLMTTVGMVFPALFLFLCSTVDCSNPYLAVAYLTLSVGFCGFHFSGHFINHGDIAPAFAGSLFGISNTAATIPGIITAPIVSAMTPNGTKEEWQATFLVAVGVYLSGTIIYVIFASGEIQPWANFERPPSEPPSVIQEDEPAQDHGEEAIPAVDETPAKSEVSSK